MMVFTLLWLAPMSLAFLYLLVTLIRNTFLSIFINQPLIPDSLVQYTFDGVLVRFLGRIVAVTNNTNSSLGFASDPVNLPLLTGTDNGTILNGRPRVMLIYMCLACVREIIIFEMITVGGGGGPRTSFHHWIIGRKRRRLERAFSSTQMQLSFHEKLSQRVNKFVDNFTKIYFSKVNKEGRASFGE